LTIHEGRSYHRAISESAHPGECTKTGGDLPRYRLFIGGEWLDASDGGVRETLNPYTAEPWAVIAEATPEDVDRAIAAAQVAGRRGEAWWKDGAARAKTLGQIADALEAHAAQIGHVETVDNGKTLAETVTQARFAARTYRYFAALADKIEGRLIPLGSGDTLDYVVREPYGVWGGLTETDRQDILSGHRPPLERHSPVAV